MRGILVCPERSLFFPFPGFGHVPWSHNWHPLPSFWSNLRVDLLVDHALCAAAAEDLVSIIITGLSGRAHGISPFEPGSQPEGNKADQIEGQRRSFYVEASDYTTFSCSALPPSTIMET